MPKQKKICPDDLKIENKKLLDIIEFLPDATFIIDTEHKVVAWNKEVEIMTGVKKEKIIGKGNDVYSLAFYNKKRPILADIVVDKKETDLKFYKSIRKEGRSIYVEAFVPKFHGGKGGYAWAKASPLLDSNGRVIGAIESVRDITDKKQIEENLRKSEKKYREFTDTLPQTVFEVDDKGKITFINSMVLNQFGYTKEEVINKMNIDQFVSEEQIETARRFIVERIAGKPNTNTVFRVKRKDGGELLVNIYASVIRNEKKKPVGLRGVVIDVTDLEKNARELKKSEQKYQSLFELSPDAIGVVVNQKITFANMAMLTLLGAKSHDQIVGKNLIDFVEKSARNYVSKKIDEMIKSKEKMPLIEEQLIRHNGKVVNVELTASPLKSQNGEVIQIVARDISQRKKVEDNLQKLYFETSIERQKMEVVLNSMGDAVFALDKDRNIILVNPIASDLAGEKRENIIGKKYNETFKFVLEKERTEITKFIDDVYERGQTTSISDQTVLINKKGNLVAVSDSAAPIKDNKGKVVGCVVIFRDVTKERQIDKAKSEFVSVASHQLRTPLSAIKWFLELLISGVPGQLSEEQKHYINQVIASNDRMIRLVNELLNTSRMETGNLVLRQKTTDLNEIVKDVYNEILPKVLEKKQKLFLDVNEKLMIYTDPTLLRQVIDNLVTNANRYTQPGGSIVIKTFTKDSMAVFEVKDNGYGIPENQKNKLFSKFFRADNIVTKQTDGTGLGLYVAKSAIESLGGTIWFESKENEGSTFCFSLPLDKQLSKS